MWWVMGWRQRGGERGAEAEAESESEGKGKDTDEVRGADGDERRSSGRRQGRAHPPGLTIRNATVPTKVPVLRTHLLDDRRQRG